MIAKTIYNWLSFPVKAILIVDWNSHQPVKETLQQLHITDKRITIARVHDQPTYHHSNARNLKTFLTDTEWVLSVDADVTIKPDFFSRIHKLQGKKLYCLPLTTSDPRFGTTMYRRQDFIDIGGCNPDMQGWGFEDLDLNQRLIQYGCQHIQTNIEHLFHYDHDDSRRTEFTNQKNKWKSNSDNMFVASQTKVVSWKDPDVNYTIETLQE